MKKKIYFSLIMPAIIFVFLITGLIVKSFISLPVNDVGGKVENAVYVNEYFDVKYTFPAGYAMGYMSDGNDFTFDGETGYYCKTAKKYKDYKDSTAINMSDASSIETHIIPKKSNHISKSKLLKQTVEEVGKKRNCVLEKKHKIKIAKRKFKVAELKGSKNNKNASCSVAVREKDGSYLLIIVYASQYSEKTSEKLLEEFIQVNN